MARSSASVRGTGSETATIGTSAAGKSRRSGTQTPWSQPRCASSTGSRPASANAPATSRARSGAPGAG